jgi:hypothetical protein
VVGDHGFKRRDADSAAVGDGRGLGGDAHGVGKT